MSNGDRGPKEPKTKGGTRGCAGWDRGDEVQWERDKVDS